jgi:hypothetical protein
MKDQINQYDSKGRQHRVWEWYYRDGTLEGKEYYIHIK